MYNWSKENPFNSKTNCRTKIKLAPICMDYYLLQFMLKNLSKGPSTWKYGFNITFYFLLPIIRECIVFWVKFSKWRFCWIYTF